MSAAAPIPLPASTVLLLRDGAAGIEVLMVRRGKRAAFMADAFVFPGGRVDAGEPFGALGAAVREAFEEAGVLLCRSAAGGFVHTDGNDWVIEARRALHAKTLRFAELMSTRELRPASDVLVEFARWITPASEPRRYDTVFFLAPMPPGQTPDHDAIEVSEHRWGTPAELLAANARREIKLPPPTFWHLRDLRRCASVEAALAWGRTRPQRPVCPKLVPVGDTLAVVLPWDPEYALLPGDGEPIDKDDSLAGAITRFMLDDGCWVPHPAGAV